MDLGARPARIAPAEEQEPIRMGDERGGGAWRGNDAVTHGELGPEARAHVELPEVIQLAPPTVPAAEDKDAAAERCGGGA